MEALYRLSYVGTQKNIQKILKVLPQKWSGKRDSNPRPSAWKADALPIELFPHLLKFWWGGEDSNLRRLSRQIYSLIPLTTREPPLTNLNFLWSWREDLNLRPADYKSAALPTELRQQSGLT